MVEETRAWAATADATPAPAAPAQPARAAAPRHPRFVLVIVIVRRSPVAFATIADAAREVSRGRAPPLS